MFEKLVKRAVQISKAFGVITVLIGFPAALLGGYRFSGEVYDTFSTPDVSISFPRLTLRCFYRISNQADYERYRAGDVNVLVQNCNASRLAVSFAATFQNDDRIGRTITDLSVTLDLPQGAPEIKAAFDHVWQVSHQIDGVIESNTRDPWGITPLPAGVQISQELWIMQSAARDMATSWQDVLTWLIDANQPPDNQEIKAVLTATVSGETTQFQCNMVLRPASLARFRDFQPISQIRFTGQCNDRDF